MRIRISGVGDEEYIRDLATEAFAPYGDYESVMLKWLKLPGVVTYVSEQNDQPTGYVMLAFFREKRTLVGDVLAIAVSAPYRGLGCGRKLLQHAITVCEQTARHSPVRALRLSVADTNLGARQLFESCGFRQVEGSFGTYEGGQKTLHMERLMPSKTGRK